MIRLGYNGDKQTSLSQVPRNILLAGIDVPTFRGKRFIEVNAADVLIENVSILDVVSPISQDCQAIGVLNSPGNIVIRNVHLQAVSQSIMLGGDRPWIPGNHIKNVLIEDALLDKPLEWKLQGLPVKNNFEIKDGWDVTLRRVTCRNSWAKAQVGYAIVLTPARGSLRNILLEDCIVENAGGCFNLTGVDASGTFTERTQVTVKGGTFSTNKTEMGGTGWFALVGRGVEYFRVSNADIDCDAQVIVTDGSLPIDEISLRGCKFSLNKYGISVGGHHAQLEHPFPNTLVKELIIEENTISGATAKFKLNFPNNEYV